MNERGIGILEAQDYQHGWLLERGLDTNIRVQSEKFLEEVPEAQEALAILQSDYTSENEKKFAEELIDVIIVSLGLIAIMGLNGERMMEEKFITNSIKYDLTTMIKLQAEGMTPQESMFEMKRRWNEARA